MENQVDAWDDEAEKAQSREDRTPSFRDELLALINRKSVENGSNTPDFILADYLLVCLSAFEKAVNDRDARQVLIKRSVEETEAVVEQSA